MPKRASPRPSGRCRPSSSSAIAHGCPAPRNSGPGWSPCRARPSRCGGSRRSCAAPTSQPSRPRWTPSRGHSRSTTSRSHATRRTRQRLSSTAIDHTDRSMRQYPGRQFLACLPRTPGSVTATIEDGPRGRLTEPLEVTCTTTVTESDLRVWQADLEIAWPATDDHPAGRWARQLLFDGEGTVQTETDIAPGTGEALAFPGDPSTIDPPSEVATFAPGDLVRSIGPGAGTAFNDMDAGRPAAGAASVSGTGRPPGHRVRPRSLRRARLLPGRHRRRGRVGRRGSER